MSKMTNARHWRARAQAAAMITVLILIPSVTRGWEIRRFDARITIGADARLKVVETLQVNFGSERVRGFTRTLPLSLADPAGYQARVDVRVLAVTDAGGRRVPARITRSNRDLRIWIGADDTFITGEQTYVLTYTADGAVLSSPTRDELYWQVTGYQWDVPILHAEAIVEFPAEVDLDELDAVSVVGKFGEYGRQAGLKAADASRVRFVVSQGLVPHAGFLVSVVWPAGLVEHPGPIRRAGRFLARQPLLLLPPLVLLIAIGVWARRTGRWRLPPG
jgi:hypothetical protein